MKLKKTVSAIIVSLVLVILAGLVILWNIPQLTEGEYLDGIIARLFPSEGSVRVNIGSIDRNFLRSLNISDVNVFLYENQVFHSEIVRIRIGLADLIRIALSKPVKSVNAIVFDSNLTVTDNVILYFSTPSDGGQGGTSSGLSSLGFELDIRNLSLLADTSDFKACAEGIDAYIQKKGTLGISLNTRKIDIESAAFNAKASLSGLALQVSDVLGDAEINASATRLDIASEYGLANLTAVEASALLSSVQDNNVTLRAGRIEADSEYAKGFSDSFNAYANLSADGSVWGGLETEYLSLTSFSAGHLEEVSAQNVSSLFRYSDLSGLILSVEKADIAGKTDLEGIEEFEFGLSGSMEYRPEDSMPSKAYLNISNLKFDLLPVPAALSLGFSEEGAEAELRTDGLELKAVYGEPDGNLRLRMNLDSFKAYPYMRLFEAYLPVVAPLIDEKTVFNASLTANGKPDSQDPEGHVTFNAAVRDLHLGNGRLFNGALSLDTDIKDRIIDVNTLALTAVGYRLTYTGLFDLDTLFPEGRLLVTGSENGSQIADFSFALSEDKSHYTYNGSVSFMPDSSFSGKLTWAEGKTFLSDLVFRTPYQDFPVSIEVNTENLEIAVSGDHIKADLKVGDDARVYGSGTVKDAAFHLNENLIVRGSTDFDGFFDIAETEYELNLNEVLVDISDIAYIGFDISLHKNRVDVTRLLMGRFDNSVEFTGTGYLDYGSVSDLINMRTEAFSGIVSLRQTGDDEGKINLVLNNDNYIADIYIKSSVNAKLSMLGERGYGFFADCLLGDVSFKAEYRDKVIRLFNSTGSIAGFSIDDFGININLAESGINGRLGLSVIADKYENTEVGAVLEFSTDIESVSNLVLSYAGVERHAVASLGVRDFHIGDVFTAEDFDIGISVDSGTVGVTGGVVNGRYDILNRNIEISVSDALPFAFTAKGTIGRNIDLMISGIRVELPILMQLAQVPYMHVLDGVFTGDVLVKGPSHDPSLFGMLYSSRFEMDLFYLPDQSLIANSIAISLNDHDITIASTPAFGQNMKNGNFFRSYLSFSAQLDNLSLGNVRLDLDKIEQPIDFWMPLLLSDMNMNIRSNVTGHIILNLVDGNLGLGGDITVSDLDLSLKLPEGIPEWYFTDMPMMNVDIEITTGKNCAFFYPEEDDAFLNFTLTEGETLSIYYNNTEDIIRMNGDLPFKTGRIYYFQNDFYITDGSLRITKPLIGGSGVELNLNLTARLRQYDSDGRQVDIYLILQNASFDNFVPRFESSPVMSDAEIMQMLGQSIIQDTTSGITLYSLASVATAAADAFSTLGIINQNNRYKLSSSIRQALGLDMFTLRSSILENLVISYLPGSSTDNRNLVAAYLNGTSVFAGKYFLNGLFGRAAFVLNSRGAAGGMNTLNIDFELSVDWDNTLGSFSIFTRPAELSILSFLDTIGFSFTKRILL